MSIRDLAEEQLSALIGPKGTFIKGTEDGTFAHHNDFALAKLSAGNINGDLTFVKQQVIFFSEVESIRLSAPTNVIPLNSNMKSGAVESFKLKLDADVSTILSALVTKVNNSRK